jgi:HK97 family phage portal protein
MAARYLWSPVARFLERRGAIKSHPAWSVVLDELEMSGAPYDPDRGYARFDQDADAFFRTIGLFPWLTSCARINATGAAAQPPLLKIGRGRNSRYEDDHDLVRLMESPRPDCGGLALRWGAFEQLEYSGEAFLAFDGEEERLNGEPVLVNPTEIHLLPSKRVRIVPSRSNRRPIDGFHFEGPVKGVFIPYWRVCHVKYPNPFAEDPLHGLSKVKPLEKTLRMLWHSREWNLNFFRNAARLSGVIQFPKEMSEENYKRYQEQLFENVSGTANAHRPLILEGGGEWKEMGVSPKDAEMVKLWMLGREEVIGGMGTPPLLLGLLDKASYANARESNRVWLKRTVMTMTDLFYGALNCHTAVKGYGDDVLLEADFSGEESLQKDALQEAQRHQIYAHLNAETPNEIREEVGLGDGKPLEGGDEVLGSGGMGGFPELEDGGVGEGEDESSPPEDVDDDADEEPEEDDDKANDGLVLYDVSLPATCTMGADEFVGWLEERGYRSTLYYADNWIGAAQIPTQILNRVSRAANARSVRHPDGPVLKFALLERGACDKAGLSTHGRPLVAKGRRAQQWKGLVRRQQPIERAWNREVRSLFRGYADRVLAALARLHTAELSLIGAGNLHEKARVDESTAEVLARAARIADTWNAPFLELSRATMKAGSNAMRDFFQGPAVDLSDPQVLAFLSDRTARHVRTIERTQLDQLHAIVFDALERNATTDELERSLRQSFRGLERWQSQRIARTETLGLFNAGAESSMKAAGISKKEWLSTPDGDTREAHAQMDGTVVDVNADFYLPTGNSGPYPGGTNSEDDINCRCQALPVIEGGE